MKTVELGNMMDVVRYLNTLRTPAISDAGDNISANT
jgi:hypothetical protein